MPIIIGKTIFDFTRPYLVGVVNITPDSFSDGGKYFNPSDALVQIEKCINEGADIIEVGAESSRPGAEKITVEEEIGRLSKVLEKYHSYFSTPLSLDTYKIDVAEFGLSMGADMINHIYGATIQHEMLAIIKKYDAAVCLMHMQNTPQTMQHNPEYKNIVEDIKSELLGAINLAQANNINKIIIDPGIGFGKKLEHNLTILKNLESFSSLGCPLMIGTSKKSFIGKITNEEVGQRLEGTISSNILAFLQGANFFRVHDVGAVKKALEMVLAIQNA
ncbi:dihydropteroate synthase [Candidatus Margulisiibacteriota bacterium]